MNQDMAKRFDEASIRTAMRTLAFTICAVQAQNPAQKAQLQAIAEAHDALRYALGEHNPDLGDDQCRCGRETTHFTIDGLDSKFVCGDHPNCVPVDPRAALESALRDPDTAEGAAAILSDMPTSTATVAHGPPICCTAVKSAMLSVRWSAAFGWTINDMVCAFCPFCGAQMPSKPDGDAKTYVRPVDWQSSSEPVGEKTPSDERKNDVAAIDHYREGLYCILRGASDPIEIAATYLGEDAPVRSLNASRLTPPENASHASSCAECNHPVGAVAHINCDVPEMGLVGEINGYSPGNLDGAVRTVMHAMGPTTFTEEEADAADREARALHPGGCECRACLRLPRAPRDIPPLTEDEAWAWAKKCALTEPVRRAFASVILRVSRGEIPPDVRPTTNADGNHRCHERPWLSEEQSERWARKPARRAAGWRDVVIVFADGTKGPARAGYVECGWCDVIVSHDTHVARLWVRADGTNSHNCTCRLETPWDKLDSSQDANGDANLKTFTVWRDGYPDGKGEYSQVSGPKDAARNFVSEQLDEFRDEESVRVHVQSEDGSTEVYDVDIVIDFVAREATP